MMNIEDILKSKGRIKVLKSLLKHGAVNINTLIRETGLTHKLVSKYVRELVDTGFAFERRYGRLRIIEINFENPKVTMLKALFEE